ncbi:MAG: SGNH/GDSL hydrolase family protein [Candidatus Magasanikbacteria bacterium]|nr:SGNH/GDSL hydrolase family protein [Candidatus Magasanikbacteria bacterium]
MNKKILVPLSILLVLIAYLFYSHHYIYKKIGQGHLPEVDKTHNYMIGNNQDNQEKIVYAAIGDSLSSGAGVFKYEDSFPYRVADELAKKGKAINLQVFAYPGARTNNLIDDLLEPAIASQPDMVTLLIGTNDMHGFISLDKYEKNYRYILDQLTGRTKAKIYLISVPFIGSEKLLIEPWMTYFDHETVKFNQVVEKLAREYNLQYIDIATPTATKFRQSGTHYSVDLFHPSAEGYELWSKIIYDKINF